MKVGTKRKLTMKRKVGVKKSQDALDRSILRYTKVSEKRRYEEFLRRLAFNFYEIDAYDDVSAKAIEKDLVRDMAKDLDISQEKVKKEIKKRYHIYSQQVD
ncbi:hypothetical protein LCGC14_0504860 [marine sediment metagenome]|uniref:Uncharacterized protein n=1 Tax=marine sediment metagenome TaxID=412755 RepID=A0A0F9VBF1_9ZZZZ